MSELNYENALLELTILCCEDESDAREHLGRIFTPRVARVWLASNGEEGLKLYKRYRPDLVISDIKMPRMTGLEMSRAIKTANPKAQIILLTAFEYKNFLQEAIDIGVSQYVSKPIGEKKLFSALYRCIDLVLAEKKIAYQNRYIQSILDAQNNLIFVTEGEGVQAANRSFIEYFGYTSLPALREDYHKGFNDRLFTYKGKSFSFDTFIETIIKNRSGKVLLNLKNTSGRFERYMAEYHPFPNLQGRFLVSLTDVSHMGIEQDIFVDAKAQKEALKNRAVGLDPITHLPFQSTLEEKADAIMAASAQKERTGLLFMTLPNFQEINRTFGFDVGDRVLSEIASDLRRIAQKEDALGRLSGASFGLVLNFTRADHIKRIANRIQLSMKERLAPYLPKGLCKISFSELSADLPAAKQIEAERQRHLNEAS